MQFLKSILLFCALILVFPVFSQDEEEGLPDLADDGPRFFVGANAGAYFANQGTANYYRGDTRYTFGVEWIWQGQNPNGTTNYNYENIKASLGDLDFSLGELPDSMKYKPGMLIGLNLGYMVSQRSGIFADVNIVTLKMTEVVTLWLEDPNNPFVEPTIHQATLTGEEKRLNVTLGYRHLFPTSSPQAAPYIEIGASFNNTKPTENKFHVNSLSYSILPPENSSYYGPQKQGGSGYGGVLGAGLHYKMNNNFRFDLGFNLKMEKIYLLPEIEQKFALNGSIYLRFLFL